MANASSKQQKIYIFCEICHTFTLYWAKDMFMYFVKYVTLLLYIGQKTCLCIL